MPNEYNTRIIEEFRANEGKVGGPFAGAPMALLTTIGAKTGQPHTTPLVYLQAGDQIAVIASMGGAPRHPQWYWNIRANPDVTVEVGTERYAAKARITEGAERDELFAKQVALLPTFGEYQQRTSRVIPVIVLERV